VAEREARLEAAGGLGFAWEDGRGRVFLGEPDWLGPCELAAEDAAVRPALAGPREGRDDLGDHRALDLEWRAERGPVRASVRAYRESPLLVFRLEAPRGIEGLATGAFDRPSLAWPRLRPRDRAAGGVPEGTRAFGHAYTEFGLPVVSDASLAGFFLLPQRPAVVWPLWLLAPDGRALLLAPLDRFHEQVIAVPRRDGDAADGVRCGWHGDLDAVPAGFASELAVAAGDGPRALLEDLGAFLRGRHGTRRPPRTCDDVLARLSYWTDNGAAYWYRSEPGEDPATTLGRVSDGLREAQVPVRAFEIDSWFYPHEHLRPINGDVQVVPPSGCMRWEPREDALPGGFPALQERLGGAPLVLHGRHFASASPYFEGVEGVEGVPAWHDGDRAHPRDPALFDALLSQARAWGAVQYEQDWLVESFLGVRGLREAPDRARAWQEGLDRAASDHGLHLLWCMATPADFFQTLTLERVAAIRTSGDYRYVIGNASLWTWFLFGNALARAVGLPAFKDVFLSDPTGEGLDGDPHAEAEALLSALSAGPVGIGDRVGRTNREIVLRTCRPDGVLVKPDVPVAALDRCYRAHPHLEPEPLLGETHSEHPAGRWTYLVALHAWRGDEPLAARVPLADLGRAAPTAPVVAYDWRSGRFLLLPPGGALELELAPRDWRLWVLCPRLPGDLALVGDVSRYACAGTARLRGIEGDADGLSGWVLGAPGEEVALRGWAAARPRAALVWTPDGARPPAGGLDWDGASGRFDLRVALGGRGWARVRVERG